MEIQLESVVTSGGIAVSGVTNRCVVLADVVASREIDDRQEFRSTLEGALDAVNDRYVDAIEIEFESLKGIDEFGGVLGDFGVIYRILRDLTERLHPTAVRFGVATDRIDVVEADATVSDLDGPAFHRADDLLAMAEADDLLVGIDTLDTVLDPLLLVGIDSLLRMRESWTETQLEAVRAYRRDESQYDAAEALGISQQAVSKALSRAGYDRVTTLESHLNGALEAAYADA